MANREKILLALFLGAIIFGVAVPKLLKVWSAPVTALEDERRRLRDDLDEEIRQQSEVFAAQRAAGEIAETALPGDVNEASFLYTEWLTACAEQIGRLEDLRVAPETAIAVRNAEFSTVRVRVTGRARRDRFDQFLAVMETVRLRHRISGLQVERLDGGSELKINATFEAMAHPAAPVRSDSLFPSVSEAVIDDNSIDYDLLTTKAQPPLLLRQGSELIAVTQSETNDWQTQRGFWGTGKSSGGGSDQIEIIPLAKRYDREQLAEVPVRRSLFSPVLRPEEIQYRIELVGDLTFGRGQMLDATFSVSPGDIGQIEWRANDDLSPLIALDQTSDGKLRLRWEPEETSSPIRIPITVTAVSDSLPRPLSRSVEVLFDTAPKTDLKAQELPAGIAFERRIVPEDPDPSDVVTVSVSDLPQGAKFDSKSQTFSWTPPSELAGKSVTIPVQLQDRVGDPVRINWKLSIVNDPLADVRLVYLGRGFDSTTDGWTGLVTLGEGSQSVTLLEQKPFKIGPLKGEVVSMTGDAVVLRLAEKTLRWQLGTPFRTATEIPTPDVTEKEFGEKAEDREDSTEGT